MCGINLSLCPSGGVYDSDEAKVYWKKRFGNLFADLATIQVRFRSLAGGNSFILSEGSNVPATVSRYIRGAAARARFVDGAG